MRLTQEASKARIIGNTLIGNLYGVDIHGAKGTLVAGNIIIGRQDHRMNARGNGVYVWNAPGADVIGNDIRYGRDGFSSTPRIPIHSRATAFATCATRCITCTPTSPKCRTTSRSATTWAMR